MKSVVRFSVALLIVLALGACKSAPEAQPEAAPTPSTPPPVDTSGAPDPRDYTDARNFDNPESLLSKRVIYFDFDKSTVRPEFRGIIAAHAAYMTAHTSARVTLEGHADERGTREYNIALGERRANSVRDYMVANGISSFRIESVSYGEEQPVAYGSGESNWAQNRRVELKPQ